MTVTAGGLTRAELVAMPRELVGCDPLRDLRYKGAAAAREQADWLKYLELAGKAPRTLVEYERITAGLLRAFPTTRFAEFTDGDISHVLAGVSKASRAQNKSVIGQWFKWGVKTKRIPVNPTEFLPDMYVRPNRRYDFYLQPEWAALTGLPHPDGGLMAILFWAGLRREEAIQLTGKRVDFDGERILVIEGAKGAKPREVTMLPPLLSSMAAMFTLEGIRPDDYVWYSRSGMNDRHRRAHPISPSRFYVWWKEAHEEAAVRRRNPHLARHTMATLWRSMGQDWGDIADALGHESVDTTKGTYVHEPADSRSARVKRVFEASVYADPEQMR